MPENWCMHLMKFWKGHRNHTIGDTRSEVNVENVSNRVLNAFDILMDSVGGHTIKTPGKGTKRLQKSSVRNERLLEREIKLKFFKFFNFSKLNLNFVPLR